MPRHHKPHKHHPQKSATSEATMDPTTPPSEEQHDTVPTVAEKEPLESVDSRLEALHASFKNSVQTSCTDLNAMTESKQSTLESLTDAVKHSDVVTSASHALSEVVDKITAHPMYHQVSEHVHEARQTLVDTIQHLKEFAEHATSSIPDNPLVKRVLEALERSVAALNSLKQTAITDGHKVSEAVVAYADSARVRATEAVEHAKTYIQETRSRLSDRAAKLVDEAHLKAVSAARKAGELDRQYHVQERAVELGKKWHVPEYAARAEALVKDLDAKYSLQGKAQTVLSKAQSVDERITSGKGAALFNWSYATALRGFHYAQSLYDEFQSAAGNGTTTAETGSTIKPPKAIHSN